MKFFIHTLFFFLLITQICFSQWVQVGLNDKSIKDVAVQNSNIFTVTSDSCLYRSVDNGANWTMIVDSKAVDVEISSTGKVFMITDSSWSSWSQWDSLYTSKDNGDSWLASDAVVQLADSFENVSPNKITITPEGNVILSIFYSVPMTEITGFGISNDDGLSWSTPGQTVIGGNIFDFRDNFIITNGFAHGAGAYGGYIYLSSDYGINWNRLGDPPCNYPKAIGFFTNGNIILVADWVGSCNFPGIYISEDLCNIWVQIATLNSETPLNTKIGIHWSSGSSEGMLIGTEDLGVLLFSDEGDSLGSRNEGLTNLNVQALTLDNNGYVYAGNENGVWRRPLSEIVTSVDDKPTQPTEFVLEQNYPNPFNPSTTISYQLPMSSDITLKVYDILGNEIATVVNEYKPAGRYQVEFNAATLSSGVYFYQLKAGDYVNTKKMILLK